MAFVLTKKRVVEWPVTIGVPVDGGDVHEMQCSATFEIIDQDEYNKLVNNDIEFLLRVVVSFGDDIQNEDGTPMLCTAATKSTLFKAGGYIRVGFLNAYHAASTGIGAKNSKGPRASSQPARKTRKKK